ARGSHCRHIARFPFYKGQGWVAIRHFDYWWAPAQTSSPTPKERPTMARVPGAEPPGGNAMSDTDAEWEQRIRERAYFLWQAEGCPEGRGIEFWVRARALESEAARSTGGESTPASARTSTAPLDRQRERGA